MKIDRIEPIWNSGLDRRCSFCGNSRRHSGHGRQFESSGSSAKNFWRKPAPAELGWLLPGTLCVHCALYGLPCRGCNFRFIDWARIPRDSPGSAQEKPVVRHNFIDRYAALDSPLAHSGAAIEASGVYGPDRRRSVHPGGPGLSLFRLFFCHRHPDGHFPGSAGLYCGTDSPDSSFHCAGKPGGAVERISGAEHPCSSGRSCA